jgi:hypothetical protein
LRADVKKKVAAAGSVGLSPVVRVERDRTRVVQWRFFITEEGEVGVRASFASWTKSPISTPL